MLEMCPYDDIHIVKCNIKLTQNVKVSLVSKFPIDIAGIIDLGSKSPQPYTIAMWCW